MFIPLPLLLPLEVCAATRDHVVLISIDGLAAFYLSDPQAPLPTLRRLAAEGAVAEGLRVSNPSTTWPNHTSLVTGTHPDKHSVLLNGKLLRQGPGRPVSIDAERNKAELVAVPAIFDRLHTAGLRTAAINWPCTRGADTLDDNFPDAPDRIRQTTPRLRAELVRDGILDNTEDDTFMRKGPAAADQAWTRAAVHLLKVRPPALLMLHLLATDVEQHRHGPQSQAAYGALAQADAEVAEVLQALDKAGLRQRTTVFVVSDHGFARTLKLVNPNVRLRKAGLLRPGPHRRAQCISEGGIALVYLTNPPTAPEDRAKVIASLRGVEGIAEILQPGQYRALHLPDPAKNPQMGDLVLVARQGYAFGDESFEDEVITPLPGAFGSHGYLASESCMNGVLVVWGPRVKPGTKLGLVDNVDVAPTIAALLGVTLPGADGRVLRELWSKSRQD